MVGWKTEQLLPRGWEWLGTAAAAKRMKIPFTVQLLLVKVIELL